MYYNIHDDRRTLSSADTVILKTDNNTRESYIIDRVAGVGGMAVTYIAKKEGENKWVVLKELFPKQLDGFIAKRRDDGRIVIYNPLTVNESNNEREVWQKLLHFMEHEKKLSEEASALYGDGGRESQNNADILNVSGPYTSVSGNYYLKIDTYDGMSLSEYITRSGRNIRANIEELLLILSKVCVRLSALHGLGILHLDLSPANIYLSKINAQTELSPYIIDFASAYKPDLPEECDHYFTCNPFSAPEIRSLAELQNPDHGYTCNRTSDTYSIASILFYAVIGKIYTPEDRYSVLWRNKIFELFPADVYKDFPSELVNFFESALSSAFDLRYSNAAKLSEKLLELKNALSSCGLLCMVSDDELMGYLIFYKYPVYRLYENDSSLNVLCLGAGVFTQKTVLGLIGTGQMLNKKLNISIVSRDSEACRSEIIKNAPLICDYSNIISSPKNPELEYVSFDFCEESDLLTADACDRIAAKYASYHYVIISLGENTKNANLASLYSSALAKVTDNDALIHYYMDEDAARNIKYEKSCRDDRIRLCPFNIASYKEELDELGELAFKTHLLYSKAFDPSATRASVIDHYLKDEYSQKSSAISALHLKYKLASVGIITDLEQDEIPSIRKKYDSILEDRSGDLIMLEHKRWMMEKASEGYTLPKDMSVIEKYAYTVDSDGEFIKGFKRQKPNLHHCLVPCKNSGTVLTALRNEGRWPDFSDYDEIDSCKDFDELDKVSLKVHLLAQRICTDKDYLKKIALTVNYIEAALPEDSSDAVKLFKKMKKSVNALKQRFSEPEDNEARKRAINDAKKAVEALKILLKESTAGITALTSLNERLSVFSEAAAYVDYKANDEIIIKNLFFVIEG